MKNELAKNAPLDRAQLEPLISFAVELRQALGDNPNPGGRMGNAQALFTTAKAVFQEIVGPDALRLIYGDDPPADAPLKEHLAALTGRLSLLEDFFYVADNSAPSSVRSAKEEIEAISHGDHPRLFASRSGISGRPTNAYRLARRQLRALEWVQYLLNQGWTRAKCHNAVATAFGANWTTIDRWHTQIVRELGQEDFDRIIQKAKSEKPFISSWLKIDPVSGEINQDEPDIHEQLRIDGRNYLNELRFR